MIEFRNSIYKAEHDKAPRGVGQWGFYVPIRDGTLYRLECPFEHYQVENFGGGRYCLVWASKVMTLTEAKKELADWLKSKGMTSGVIQIAD